METSKTRIERDSTLQAALMELEVGGVLEVPYKRYSAATIRAVCSQLKAARGLVYEVNTRGEKAALIARTA